MRTIAIGRIVGLVLAVFGIGMAICLADSAVRAHAELHQWAVARPMETVIDLSQPGEVTVPFRQTCSCSHGEALYLQCDLEVDSEEELKELLEDLSAKVVIKDSDGAEVESFAIDNNTAYRRNGKIILAGFATIPNGDYTATIRVTSGASALAGKQQTIYAKYQLCGLESMPATISYALAFGFGLLGFVAALCVLPGLLRFGIRRDVPGDEPKPTGLMTREV